MKKFIILISASMLIVLMLLFISCQGASGCDPCTFEVNYDDLDKIEDEFGFHYVKKGTVIKYGPYMYWHDEERKNIYECGCYKDDTGAGFYLTEGQEEFEDLILESDMNYIGIKDGLCVKWWKNGHKQEEGTYKNGKKDGLWISWWMNGNKRSEANYQDGSVEVLISWDENGQKRNERNYINGLWINWYGNGKKSIEENYEDNRLVKRTTWYRNGNKWEEGNYDDGRWIGIHWRYKEDGTCLRGLDYGDGSGEPIEIKCP